MDDKLSFCSWSGGKDSCLSLYRALKQGYQVSTLFCMLTEKGHHSRSHGLPRDLLEAQAGALGIPIRFGKATWEHYEANFLSVLKDFYTSNIRRGIFGDIDIEGHRAWVEQVCQKAGMKAVLPLWKEDRSKLLAEFLGLGFSTIIVAVREDVLDESWLGRKLTGEVISELRELGVDAAGENGEYHTFVCGGPIFKHDVPFKVKGTVKYQGYAFLDIGGKL